MSAVAAPLLEVADVTKRFGGVVANAGITFTVAPGEVVGVIGPNGAGKSTLFDVITGFCQPEGGEVRFAGDRITGFRPDAINRRGIARTFQ
jgi:ABC-type branched-subunit amino acid transport system ATPase component